MHPSTNSKMDLSHVFSHVSTKLNIENFEGDKSARESGLMSLLKIVSGRALLEGLNQISGGVHPLSKFRDI